MAVFKCLLKQTTDEKKNNTCLIPGSSYNIADILYQKCAPLRPLVSPERKMCLPFPMSEHFGLVLSPVCSFLCCSRGGNFAEAWKRPRNCTFM